MVNPVAGKGRAAAAWEYIAKYFSKTGMDQKVYVTQKRGDGRARAIEAVREGAKRIISVGGDGTLHEVVNGVYGADVEIGLIPAGTGNDFARTVGIPSDPLQAAMLAVTGQTRPVDLGRVNREIFVNAASVGFDAEVTNDTNNRGMVINGTITYLVSVFATLRKYRCSDVEITIDGRVIRERILLAAIGNGQYYGGGMRIAPKAVIDDGFLDVVVAGNLSKFETIVTLPKVYSGRHIEHPKASIHRGKKISIATDEKLYVQADGEIVGLAPVTFEVLEGALKIVR